MCIPAVYRAGLSPPFSRRQIMQATSPASAAASSMR